MRLHHACLRVRALEPAESFYVEGLGLRRLWTFALSRGHAAALLGIDAPCRFLTLGGEAGRLEVFQADVPWTPPAAGAHVGFLLADRDAVLARLAERNAPVREAVREGRRIVFVADPDGNWIELKPAEG